MRARTQNKQAIIIYEHSVAQTSSMACHIYGLIVWATVAAAAAVMVVGVSHSLSKYVPSNHHVRSHHIHLNRSQSSPSIHCYLDLNHAMSPVQPVRSFILPDTRHVILCMCKWLAISSIQLLSPQTCAPCISKHDAWHVNTYMIAIP